jgi:hypothetical protein
LCSLKQVPGSTTTVRVAYMAWQHYYCTCDTQPS